MFPYLYSNNVVTNPLRSIRKTASVFSKTGFLLYCIDMRWRTAARRREVLSGTASTRGCSRTTRGGGSPSSPACRSATQHFLYGSKEKNLDSVFGGIRLRPICFWQEEMTCFYSCSNKRHGLGILPG